MKTKVVSVKRYFGTFTIGRSNGKEKVYNPKLKSATRLTVILSKMIYFQISEEYYYPEGLIM